MKLKFLVALLALVTGSAVADNDPWAGVEIITEQAADGVYMLKGQGGNIGVSVGADGVFLIDDQFAPLTDKIRAAVGALSKDPIKFVLNTHWHPDHTGGNENLGKTGSIIVAHDNVRKRLTKDGFIKQFNMEAKALQPHGLPVVTFNDEMTFHLNGDEIAIYHVGSAHTDGDSIVHFRKANVIHTGDTVFSGMYPFIDTGSGGSINGYIDAVGKTLSLADDQTVIIPGHGPMLDKARLAKWHGMLVDLRDKVQAGLKDGKSLDDINGDWPTEAYDEDFGGGRISGETLIETIYNSLKSG